MVLGLRGDTFNTNTDSLISIRVSQTWCIYRPGPGLTELLQTVQVDDVLCCSVVSGTDEEVGLLQDKVGLLPLLRVQHGSIPQQTDPLKLPSQQAVTAEGGRSLMVMDRTSVKHLNVTSDC